MKGDFTRDTFDATKHFSRVLMQQGRVQIDADWNELSDIVLHYLRTLAKDLIGDHGGPGVGFSIGVGTAMKMDFAIWQGRYYVDGILCENEQEDLTYKSQRGYPFPDSEALQNNKNHLVYLDVWERHVTALEDDTIREVALGGADTATRAQVVWQVKTTTKMPDGTDIAGDQTTDWAKWLQDSGWPKWVAKWQPDNRGRLKARSIDDAGADTDPCIIAPESRFRGAENQLYRVEIYKSGKAGEATFRWSRDNGSVVFPLAKLAGQEATLAQWGLDDRLSLTVDDWVELVDDDYILGGQTGPLAQVDTINPDEMTVVLKMPEGVKLPAYAADDYQTKHVLLRRWDYKISAASTTEDTPKVAADGALLVEENTWLTLEDGVQVWFDKPQTGESQYRAGDYWLIPARTATGDVEWPGPVGDPEARRPPGVDHHYAPLAIVGVGATDALWMAGFRRSITPAT